MKTYDADPMDLTVYATNGASRYHSSRTCRALISGQDLNDWDCWDDYCNHHLHRTPRTIREIDLAGAVADGKWPCHTCYPAGVQFPPIPPSNDDFGHLPVSNDVDYWGETTDDPPVCARCSRWISLWSPVVIGQEPDGRVITSGEQLIRFEVAVLWPCTSAIVLGLVPRPLP